MPMFGFDEQYAYYGMTPVDNRFILEYLPNATGDAVRVYLYGLVQCYNPDLTMSIEKMARELSMTEEDILKAYRHWERKGLVRRTADHPPAFQYINSQKAFNGDSGMVDYEFEEFSADVQRLFPDRRIHGGELVQCYEWVEQLGLPKDAVLYLIEHMIRMYGKNVMISTIEKRAILLAEEKVTSREDAKVVLDCDKRVLEGCREIVSKMGKRRNPTEAELKMYRSWLVDWKYTEEDIAAACNEMTAGDPSFKYLNGFLKRMNEKRDMKKPQKVSALVKQENDAEAPLRALLGVMNIRVSVNAGTLAVYQELRTLYPDNIILLAGQECAKRGLGLDGVKATLESWKRNHVETAEDVKVFLQKVSDQYSFLGVIYDILGLRIRKNPSGRMLVQRWLDEWHFDMGLVTQCASWAIGTENPMFYLNTVLKNLHDKNITTVEAAAADHEKHQAEYAAEAKKSVAAIRSTKTVEQQQYTQREYVHTEDAMDAMMRKWQEENGNA